MREMLSLFIYIYVAVFAICLPGAISKSNENADVLTKRTTNGLRGLGMILIVFAHATEGIVNSVTFFYYVSAILGVSSCFFASGYGIYSGYEKDASYFQGYFLKRFSRVLVPYAVMYVSVLTAKTVRGFPFSLKTIVREILTLQIDGLLLWYLKVQLLLYVLFFISFRLIKKRSAQIYVLIFLTIIYIVAMRKLGFAYYWYSTCIFFAVGVIVARHRQKLLPAILNIRTTVLAAAAFVMTYIFIYFKGRAGMDFLIDGIYMSSFLITMAGILNVRSGSFFLQLMGAYSMEIYLVHLVLLKYRVWGLFEVERGYTYWLLLIVTVAISIPLHYIDKRIINWIRRVRVSGNAV